MHFTTKEKQFLLLASFLALMAAGVGFVFRAMVPALWANEFGISDGQVGVLLGAGLWPIAIMMIIFSLIVDKIGYQKSMAIAFFFQFISVILTFFADSYNYMWWACITAGVGHGIVEAVINPLCVSVFRDEKTKAMNILHASWPAGIVFGGTIFLLFYSGTTYDTQTWINAKSAWWFMSIPIISYGFMFAWCKKFPVDERVENNIPMTEVFQEFGGLGAFLAITFIGYELFSQLGLFVDGYVGSYTRLSNSFLMGVFGGSIFGLMVKSKGKLMFFFICLLMIPLATAEIATDGWIQNLMKPTMGDYAGWALVFSASIMMVLRFFAGYPLKYTGPLGLLLISSIFSIIGLFSLSYASGYLVFISFVVYAIGQTFYWPSVLGFVSERFPRGGALTLNTVSAIGLLTVGIFGFPFLGAVQDHYNARAIINSQPELVQLVKLEKRKFNNILIFNESNLFGITYNTIKTKAFIEQPEFPENEKETLTEKLSQTGRKTLRVAACLPIFLVIGFSFIIFWFNKNGGYKPIDLSKKNLNEI